MMVIGRGGGMYGILRPRYKLHLKFIKQIY